MEREITGSVQVKETKSGKKYLYTVINLYDERGNRFPKWESTKLQKKGNRKKAEEILRQRITQYKALEKSKSKDYNTIVMQNVLFSDWMLYYLESIRTSIRKSTYEGYVYRINHIVDYYKDKKIKVVDLTTMEIDCFLQYLFKYGKTNQKTKKKEPLGIRSVRSVKSLIVSALNKAVIMGLIKHNPATSLKVGGKKTNAELARKFNAIDIKELNNLLKYMEDINDELTDLVKVIAYFGLRKSEALAIYLGKESLDLENRKLYIRRSIVRVKEVHDEFDTKTQSSYREYCLTDETYEMFKRIVDKKEDNKRFYGNTYEDSEFLLTWDDGKQFNPDYVSHHFSTVMKTYGKPNFTIHNLRHSCCNMLYEAGWREWEISSWLGHEDPTTTKKWYVAIDNAHNETKASTLNGKLNIS